MKQVHFFSFFLFLLVVTSIVSCSDDDDKVNNMGVISHSWTEGKALEIGMDTSLSVNFDAVADWTIHNDSENWCNLSAQAGKEGQNTLKISVNTTTPTSRTATITIVVKGYSSANFKVEQNASSRPITEDMEVNGKVDAYLREKYLWNEEYKTLDFDFTKNYEDFFYDALGSMKTNTLDNKIYTNSQGTPYYSLFSYIEKKNPIGTTRSTKQVDKELTYSFGITGITPVAIGTPNDYTLYFCIQGVYPGSPAEEAGIERGSMISQINGNKITDNNFNYYYFNLISPTNASSLTVTEGRIEQGTREINLASIAMYCNPIITSKVEEIEGHKIGYLVYSSFDAAFDQELFDVFREFKNNVTDLILDLRYNMGGHTMSANLIATCIAGDKCRGKVFTSFRYNEERMKKNDNKREDQLFAYSSYSNLDMPLSEGLLGLSRVYCLVGRNTASASELVINALEGIDVDVIRIGEQTLGKNVGMEYKDFTVKENTYIVMPITFQTYNAKGFGDYENGFAPQHLIDETNPYNEFSKFCNHEAYGTPEEPLYAKAVELITGKALSPTTRSTTGSFNGKVRKMPAIYRPGFNGMLKKSEE